MLPVRRTHRASLLLSALLFLSCSESPTEGDETRVPASLEVVSGDEQNGVVGTELANPLVVRVEDANGIPIIGQLVNFRVTSGGGSVFAGSGLTNALGIVQDRWTLGTSTAEIQRVEARAVDPNSGAPIVFATFRATPLPGPAHSLTKAGGDAQTGALGAALTDSLAARVTDSFGNPVPNVQVTWATSASNGTVSPATSQTNTQGIAKTRWTLGSRLDIPHSVTATAGTLAPATFAVTPTLPSTASVVKLAGDGASATVGVAMAESLAVRVQLAGGQVVPGVQVSWNVTSGNGTIGPQATITQSDGTARSRLTPGNIAGANTVTASVTGLTPAQFTVTGTAGAPASLVKISGDGQQGTVGQSLGQPLVVRLADQFVNPIVGATVTWEIVSGAGTLTASSSVTDAAGHASIGWTLGNTPGGQQVGALFPGLASVTFVGQANVGAPSGLTIVGGNGQTGVVGAALPQALVVRLTDALGNPIPNATVSFTVTAGGGTVTPSGSTDANGEARASWALGGVAGTQSVSASAGTASVGFIATATVGAPATIAKVSGDAQTGTIGQALAQPLVVRVQDQFGNNVPGANVVWTVLTGGGATSPPNGSTDAAGQASAQWTLGSSGGTHSVRAQVGDNITTTFTAGALVPGGSTLLVQSGDGVWARVAMEVPLVAKLVNSSGQPIAGVSVTWTPSRGTANPTSSTTDANGDASTRWTLGTVVETATLVASATGASSATFSAHVRPGELCNLQIPGGEGQVGVVGQPLPQPLQLRPTDRFGNPTGPLTISPTSTPSSNSGSLSGVLQADSNGVSEPVVWTLGSTVGRQFKIYSWFPRDQLCGAGSIVRGSIGADALAAATVTISPDSGRLFTPGDTLRFSARVTDGSGADVPNAQATWTTLDPGVASVDNNGLARAIGNGTARIVASSIGVADTALLRVSFERSVRITPSSGLVSVGDTLRFTATAFDASGAPIPAATFTWISTNESIATVDGFGLVRGHAAGSATIRAVSEDDTASATVDVTATLTRLTPVSTGGNHACGLLEDGSAVCWGYNAEGEIGDGTTTNRSTPAHVTGGLLFTTVDVGIVHSCALRGGEAYCWGANTVGQLGDGTNTTRIVPTRVSTGVTFDQISAGNSVTCALSTGRAYCWGNNTVGALGDGTTTHRTTPTAVSTSLLFTTISASAGHSCALTSAGAAYCWGDNSEGQLGDGTTTHRLTPTAVAGSLNFVDIGVDGTSTCALATDGRMYCWGSNNIGQLGDGTTVNRLQPTLVAGGLTFTAMTKGPAQACGIATGGAAYCWGFNPNGELGDGTTTTRPTPTAVSGGLAFSSLSAGSSLTCGLTTTRVTYCWGNNQWGQLGNGSTGPRSTVPARVSLP